MDSLNSPQRLATGLFIFLTLFFAGCGGGGGGGGGAGGGTAAPYVVSTTPIDNATNVQVNADISAIFSEAMNASSVNATSFTVKDSNTLVAVPGTVTYSGITATFITNALSSNTSYTATITTDAKNLAGTSMSSNKSLSFTTALPVFSGFDFPLAEGNYWQFNWKQTTSVWYATGSGTSGDSGRYWMVLGAPQTIQGINAYPIQLFGKQSAQYFKATPIWKYIASANGQLLGSIDGVTLAPFFDARLGSWPGGGFFFPQPSTELTVARNGTAYANNPWIGSSAVIVTGTGSGSSLCQYYPGVGTICSSSATTYDQQEYYRPSVGPVGAYAHSTYSDSYGSSDSEEDIGVAASSFTGQLYPLVSESEPNDSYGQAQGISITPSNPIIGDATPSDAGLLVNTVVVLDGATTSSTITRTIHDWYKLVVPATGWVSITLDFENSPGADLDLFLLQVNQTSGVSTLYQIDYSVHDNVTSKQWYERIANTLPAGTYYIGISAHTTPNSGAASYTLDAV